MDWPLREVLVCFTEILKQVAARTYHKDLQIWASLRPYVKGNKAMPVKPGILEEDK